MLAKTLRGVAYVWIVAVVAVNAFACVGFFLAEPTVWAAIGRIQEAYSPFNVGSYLVNAVMVAPAAGLLALASRVERKRFE